MITLTSKITGFSVKKPGETVTSPAPVSGAGAPNRPADVRLPLPESPVSVAEASLRWPKRPEQADGFSAWTSASIPTPTGKFALSISHVANGVPHPIEVWALGHEAPPAASLICQILSKVMQVDSPAFLAFHLDALKKAGGLDPFEVRLPHSGEQIAVRSIGAAIAHVVEAHAVGIGYLTPESRKAPCAMLDAMSSPKEPKTAGEGTLGWSVDVRNDATGEDFCFWIKERSALQSGAILPVSLWMDGALPTEAASICKLVSLAMRHRDPVWTSMVLKKLGQFAVRYEDFWAPVPGTDKQRCYGSTWAFVAAMVTYRYRQLGILDADGKTVAQTSLFAPVEAATPALAEATERAVTGSRCSHCGAHAAVRMDGCLTCLECGTSKCG